MRTRASLTIDLQAANAPLDESDLRQWAAGQSVFVSSLIRDIPDERADVRKSILELGAKPVMFEHDLGAQDVSAELCLS